MDLSVTHRAERDLVVVFLDLSLFTREASQRSELDVAALVDAYYERVADHVERASGAVIKFIGDGALLAFPPEHADAAVTALFGLRREIDDWLRDEGWSSRLFVRAHAGTVIAGGFGRTGGRSEKSFDVIGNVVNVAARLPRPFHVTPQVFRLLSPELRRTLKKHTPPVTYIPVEDRHA